MSDIAIKADNLSKQYRIGERERYKTFRDTLAGAVSAPLSRLRSSFAHFSGNAPARRSNVQSSRRSEDRFWALNDVSFDVERGEVVGIIGRNGAGKSTLLKVLSRITEPTRGRVEINGRVGSLLEVGTGFNPELTGRDNIYLNGAILGMKREEIRRRFDEMVAFAEVEKFIDTPVKRYSSGMYLRLAFAVAAHLDPDILLVDEVLAVGDAAFQKRCLGKMSDVAKRGRTVVFVSHNMPAMTRLCRRGIVLDSGSILIDSDIYSATSGYLRSDYGNAARRVWTDPVSAPGDHVAKLRSVTILEALESEAIDIRKPVTIETTYFVASDGADLMAALSFLDDKGTILFVSADMSEPEWGSKPRQAGLYRARCTIPGNMLAEGQISVTAELSTRHPVYETHVLEHDAVCFQVVDKGEPGSVRGGWGRPWPGVVRPQLHWSTELVEGAGQADGVF